MESPFQRGYTPLDTPKRWADLIFGKGRLHLKERQDSEAYMHFRHSQRFCIWESKRGASPSYHIFPFPSGEGDTGDGAITTEQEQDANNKTHLINQCTKGIVLVELGLRSDCGLVFLSGLVCR